MSSIERKRLIKESFNSFLILFVILSLFFISMIAVFYHLQVRNYQQRLFAEEQHSVNLQLATARNHFASILSDLRFLVEQDALQSYLREPTASTLATVQKDYLSYAKSKKIYDQIRFLDSGGQEVIRINNNAGRPKIVKKERLQKKSHRYYFVDAYRLSAGQIYISPLDLNVEQGKVEVPFKPMIRFGAPVFDQHGEKRGIVLLNYLGRNLLDLIEDVSSVAHGQAMLLNAEGYWLRHPQINHEWGFMFEERSHLTLAEQNPPVWRQINASFSGQLQTAAGIYTFTTLKPLENSSEELSGSGDYFWKIATFISGSTLSAYSLGLLRNLLLLAIGLLFVAAVVAWLLALAVTRRKIYQEQLFSMAHFDGLTSLPNRTLFFDRLSQSIESAKRYGRQCALLYIDLDGFKYVNDSLGHAAGDELLVDVGKRMKACCRSSDTLARLGGDEFALLLGEVTNVEGVQACVEKLLDQLREPFALKQGEAVIGASIGIALYPVHGTSLDALLKSADRAMYVSKSQGKNTFTFAES